ncbi:MAG: hypothetical protein EAS51_09695 [Microbacteriaceae bacterium]|nr:MAG: hypothetical protein EAS51_09695 [Microbacteriaceae bacterium]
MTTYPDQPLSRREIREREAAARAAEAAESDAISSDAADASAAPTGASSEPLTYVTHERTPLPQYDAPVAPTVPPVASTSPAASDPQPSDEQPAGYRFRDYSPEGRRAARLGWPPAASGPADLDYRTQNRADVPLPPTAAAVPDASSAPPVSSPTASAQPVTPPPTPPVFGAPAAAPASAASPATPPAVPEGTMTRRELRALREAQERAQASAAPVETPADPATTEPADTAGASLPPVWGAPSASTTSAAPAFDELLAGPAETEPDEPTELSAPPPLIEPTEPQSPPPLIEPAEPQTDAIESVQALFRAQIGALPLISDPTPEPAAEPTPDAVTETPQQPEAPAPRQVFVWETTPRERPTTVEPREEQQPEPAVEADPVVEPEPIAEPETIAESEPHVVEHPHLGSQPMQWPPAPASAPPATADQPFWGLTPGLAAPSPTDDAVILPSAAVPEQGQAEQAQAEQIASESQPPVPGERPRNHWSRQAELDDEAQPATGAIARSVGVGPGTANALVLPESPNPDIIVSSVTSTGDVLVTGSITLPASLASTGALPAQLDESDLDNMLDPGDAQVASTDSAPVRAIRAVSTHTSSREIIGTIKPKRGNRALTALIIAAAGMAVVVVTLLVVALASGVLG